MTFTKKNIPFTGEARWLCLCCDNVPRYLSETTDSIKEYRITIIIGKIYLKTLMWKYFNKKKLTKYKFYIYSTAIIICSLILPEFDYSVVIIIEKLKSAKYIPVIQAKPIQIFHLRQAFWEFRNPYPTVDKNVDKISLILANFLDVYIQRTYNQKLPLKIYLLSCGS